MTIDEQRQLVVAEARAWQHTPFHWHAMVKGTFGGVDCGSLMKGVYDSVGIKVELPEYSREFFLHHTVEIYLMALDRYCIEVAPPPLPGDMVVFKIGRAYGHAGVVTNWPMMIHANMTVGYVVQGNALEIPELADREKKYYSPKIWHP